MNRRDLLKAFAGVSALPMVKNVEVLRLAPQDTIVITCDVELCEAEHDALAQTMRRLFSGQRMLVLDKGFDIKVVRR